MKKFLKKNKTTIAGIATAAMAFATAKGWVDTETGIFISAVLVSLGLMAAKDQTSHSTTEQVRKADKES